MFKNVIDNVNIIAVLDLSWEHVNDFAAPRPFHALSFRIRGDAVVSSQNQLFHVQSNDILFVPKGLSYHLDAHDEHLFCIHFDTNAKLPDRIIKFTPSNSIVFEKIYGSAYEHWTKKKPGYYPGVISDFYKILSKIRAQKSETKFSNISDNMNDVIEYIHEHFTDSSLTIEQLVKISMLSECRFRKLFNENLGTSPIKYINSLRVKYATELINSGYYKIYQISEMAGFNDPKYFSRVMKKSMSLSPAELKKLNTLN